MFRTLKFVAVCLTLALASSAFAQQAGSKSQAHPEDEKGFVSFAEFSGSAGSDGHVLSLNSAAGYNFTRHFGFDFGVPFFFVGGSSTTTTGTKTNFSGTGLGAPYVDVRWMFMRDNAPLNYKGSITGSFPVGDTSKGLSTGKFTFNWNNRFEHSFSHVTPFAEAGLGNTIADTRKYHRPFLSYGDNGHVEGGVEFNLTDKFSVGGSAYDILPWGTQTIYSRVLPKNSVGLVGKGNGKQVFTQNSVTTGTADIAKDRGFSVFADFTPAPIVSAEVGFTRSETMELNSVSFSLRFNIGSLTKKSASSHN